MSVDEATKRRSQPEVVEDHGLAASLGLFLAPYLGLSTWQVFGGRTMSTSARSWFTSHQIGCPSTLSRGLWKAGAWTPVSV